MTGTNVTSAATNTRAATDNWVRTWGTSPQVLDLVGTALESLAETTLRHVVRISGGGRRVRVRFTNEYGTDPLTIGAARVGIAAPGGGIRPGTDRELTFADEPTTTVPAGAPILTDPVDLPVPSLAELSISIHLPKPVETCTGRRMGVQNCWTIPGDAVAATDLPDSATSVPHQIFLSAVEVLPDVRGETVVVVGDSITDGAGSTPDANRRWTDRLAERLAEHGGPARYVSNQGISGNRLCADGFGASVLARFDRDVLATPGLGHVVVAIGCGDIVTSFAPRDDETAAAEFVRMFPGAPVTADDVIGGYRQLIARAHGHGAKVYGATLTPHEPDDMFTSGGENERRTVNEWIRTSDAFDGVLDFDATWRDAARPTRIKDGFHAGDMHGNDAGYRALADSIDLSLFE